MSVNNRILLVDDEPDILEFVGYNLRKEGFDVHTASNGADGVEKACEIQPDLILLDVMMPVMDGMEACRKIREIPELADVMIAFLTARHEEEAQIEGFESGADDYISKPINVKVLVSRIKAMLKRSERPYVDDGPGEGSGLVIDQERYLVFKDGESIVLPRKEFNLLTLLNSKPQKVFSREEIFSQVWGNDVIVGDRTIDVHIRKLREKIGDDHIVTVKGVGYKYQD